MEVILWIALFLPLLGFLLLLFFSEVLARSAIEYIGPGAILLSFLLFFGLLGQGVTISNTTLFTWIPWHGIDAAFSLHLDHLSHLMTLIITGVGFLIHVYSVGYMEHDQDLARYFSIMNFFIFSMLLLVLAEDLLLLFVGWEGVGLASYLLIGYWYQRPKAAKAAKKAFIVNRVGDMAFLLGILLTLSLFGTVDIQTLLARGGKEFPVGTTVITTLTLLYFIGATAKSAQIPLHVWLPDAMEGPTPVSALIHAATMVTAGVYLVVRMYPLFSLAPWTCTLVSQIGAITSLFAALCATSQTDVKRVLAYSTISQLGLMFLAAGMGATFAAMFHLTCHAFVKALLFLSAGNAIHMMHGTTEMDQMGGLAKVFPMTNILFLIGVLALAGIPPLAIFFSKDLLLDDVSRNTVGYSFGYSLGLATSLLTSFYLMRAYFLTFQGFGQGFGLAGRATLKEAPAVMLSPVSLLAFLSIVGGGLAWPLMEFLQKEPFHFPLNAKTALSIAVALVGILIAYLGFRAASLRATIKFFFNAFYINQLYDLLIERPARAISKGISSIFEPKIFDAGIRITARASLKTAALLQEIQSGQIRSYLSWIVGGAGLLALYFLLEGS